MRIALMVGERSTCKRRRVGALIVKDRRILSTGYNGAPRGLPHCLDIGCLRAELNIPSGERQEICRGVHAEQTALVQAAYFGVGVADSPHLLLRTISRSLSRIPYRPGRD
jgi:dCMP deaminase